MDALMPFVDNVCKNSFLVLFGRASFIKISQVSVSTIPYHGEPINSKCPSASSHSILPRSVILFADKDSIITTWLINCFNKFKEGTSAKGRSNLKSELNAGVSFIPNAFAAELPKDIIRN